MYETIYKKQPIEYSKECRGDRNLTCIESPVRRPLKEMPVHIFNDVRVHNLGGKSQSNKAQSDTDIRYIRESSSVLKERTENTQAGVLQGVFQERYFSVKLYWESIKNVLEDCLEILDEKNETVKELKEEINGYLTDMENSQFDGNAWEDWKENSLGEILDILTKAELEHKVEQQKNRFRKNHSRLDIITDLIDHCIDGKSNYTHYHMYDGGKVGSIEELNGKSVQEQAAALLSAIDCRILKKLSIYENVLWIESFVSFAPKKGIELLKEILHDESRDLIEHVALGAYPGSEVYYSSLGMGKIEGYYSMKEDGSVKDMEGTLQYLKEYPDRDIKKGIKAITDEKKGEETEKENIISFGLEYYKIYPVYCLDKQTLIENIQKNLINDNTWKMNHFVI